MRPTQLEPVCPCTAAVRCPLAEVMRTFTQSSAGLRVELKEQMFWSGQQSRLEHWPKIIIKVLEET